MENPIRDTARQIVSDEGVPVAVVVALFRSPCGALVASVDSAGHPQLIDRVVELLPQIGQQLTQMTAHQREELARTGTCGDYDRTIFPRRHGAG